MTSATGLTFHCQLDGADVHTLATLSKLPPTFPIILGLSAAEPNFDWRSQTGHNIGRRSQMPLPETGLVPWGGGGGASSSCRRKRGELQPHGSLAQTSGEGKKENCR